MSSGSDGKWFQLNLVRHDDWPPFCKALGIEALEKDIHLIGPRYRLAQCALPLGQVFGWPFALLALLPLALATFLHAGLLRFFARRSGFAFAVLAMLFHQLHLTYSALAFAWCVLEHKLRPKGDVRPA